MPRCDDTLARPYGNTATRSPWRSRSIISRSKSAWSRSDPRHQRDRRARPSELPAGIYLREHTHTVPSGPINDFAARFRPSLARDTIETAHEIMLGIADAVEYRKGETHVHTTGAEALEQRSGVCQDQAMSSALCAACSEFPPATSAAI